MKLSIHVRVGLCAVTSKELMSLMISLKVVGEICYAFGKKDSVSRAS